MEREELLKWIKISEKILENNLNIYSCPCDLTHYISFELNFYPEFNKKELVLTCKTCDKKHIISAKID